MALKLFRLVMTATTTTAVNSTKYRYFYTTTAAIDITATQTLTLAATTFLTDTGTAAASFQTVVSSSNGYTAVYTNGELQQSGIYTAASNKLNLSGAAISVPAGGVIVLQVVKFAPASSTAVQG